METAFVPALTGVAPRRPVTLATTLAVLAVLALSIVVRCHGLSTRNLWTDEYLSLECSSGWGRSDLRVADTHAVAPDLVGLSNARPFGEIWSSMARDENHPPGYAMLLRAWRTCFGDGVVAIRSLSVVTSVIGVGLIIGAGFELGGPTCGLWAGLVVALASPRIREAQDARAYMPVAAFAAAALWLLVRTARRGPTVRRTVALGVMLAVLPMLHYMALATVGAAVLFAAIALRGSARWATLAAAVAALALDGALWGPSMVSQHHRMLEATEWLAELPGPSGPWAVMCDCAAAPIRMLVDPATQLTASLAAGGAVALLVPLLALRTVSREGRWRVLLPWLWVAAPLLTALVIDLSTHRRSLMYAKYTLVGGPALALLGGLLASSGRRLGWVPVAGVVAATLLCLPAAYDPYEPDWRPLAQFVLSHSAPTDPVLLVAETGFGKPANEVAGERLVALSYWLRGPDHRDLYVVRAGVPTTGPVQAALQRADHVCLCTSSFNSKTVGLIPSLKIDRVELFPGLGLMGTADRPAVADALGAARHVASVR